jgi:hypothetical protein
VKFYYQCAVLDGGEVDIYYIPAKPQTADGLSKPLSQLNFQGSVILLV